MPMVGKKKFGYGTKGKAAAKAYAKKTGKKMVKRKKKWALTIVASVLVVITSPNGHPVSPKSLLSLLKMVTKYASFDSEILICRSRRTSPPDVNPSEQDINAMRKSLNWPLAIGHAKNGKMSLYKNIHAKRKRIKKGSGEKMRKPGSKGAPTAKAFKKAAKTAKKKRK